MAAIDQYIERIPNTELQEQIREEVARLTKKKRFGLVYENHLPDNVLMPEVTIRRGTKVALRGNTPNDVYEVQDIEKDNAVCRNLASLEDKTFLLDDLVAVAQRGDVIYPYLKPMDSVENAPDSDLWHTLIEADNYHALQTLTYLYPGMVDCIYIDLLTTSQTLMIGNTTATMLTVRMRIVVDDGGAVEDSQEAAQSQ